jgi:hypothetical protein
LLLVLERDLVAIDHTLEVNARGLRRDREQLGRLRPSSERLFKLPLFLEIGLSCVVFEPRGLHLLLVRLAVHARLFGLQLLLLHEMAERERLLEARRRAHRL